MLRVRRLVALVVPLCHLHVSVVAVDLDVDLVDSLFVHPLVIAQSSRSPLGVQPRVELIVGVIARGAVDDWNFLYRQGMRCLLEVPTLFLVKPASSRLVIFLIVGVVGVLDHADHAVKSPWWGRSLHGSKQQV